MKRCLGFTPLQTVSSKRRSVTGFTLMELMIAVTILLVCLVGLIATYVSCFDLNETMRNYSIAVNAAQMKMEEVKNYNFYQILSHYNDPAEGKFFEIADLYTAGSSPIAAGDSRGMVTVSLLEGDALNPEVLQVSVYICWRQRGDRIIGGIVDGSGDLVPTTDSPVQLTTLITDRS